MTIELPTQRDVKAQAVAAGYASVEEYLVTLLDRDSNPVADRHTGSESLENGDDLALIDSLSPADRALLARLNRAIRDMKACVEIDPDRAGGQPVLRGTRFKVSQLLAQLADGDSVDDLVENLDLDGEDIRCLLNSLSVEMDRSNFLSSTKCGQR